MNYHLSKQHSFANTAQNEATMPLETELLFKLRPTLMERIWGGQNLAALGKDLKQKKNIGESWELSTHFAGESTVVGGKYNGFTLGQVLQTVGRKNPQTAVAADFPLIIKFIDANENLSVQVHPAGKHASPSAMAAGEVGVGGELWYIMQAKKGAFIYAGFNRQVSRKEVLRRLQEKTLEEVLQKIPVKAGERYFLKAGTVHAVGKGCLLCEITPKSSVTYRLFDYERKDRLGCLRPLQVEKALASLNFNSSVGEFEQNATVERLGKVNKTTLGRSAQFSAFKYESGQDFSIAAQNASPCAFVIAAGAGSITAQGVNGHAFQKGDTFLGMASNYTFQVKEKAAVIAVYL